MMKKANLVMNSWELSKSGLFKRVECLCDCRAYVCEAFVVFVEWFLRLFKFEKIINFVLEIVCV